MRDLTEEERAELLDLLPNEETATPVCVDIVVEWFREREKAERPSPREEFEAMFGAIFDYQWQWLKEFVDRNTDKPVSLDTKREE